MRPSGAHMTAAAYDSPNSYAAALAEFLSNDERADPYKHYRPESLEHGVEHLRGLQSLLFEEGWSRLGWPERCGGLGGDPRFRGAMFETLWDLDIPVPEMFNTLEILVPVLLVHAPHLAVEFFPSVLRGDEGWAQAFSEPDAGSDL